MFQYFGSHPAPGRPLGHVNAWTDRAPFFCKCYFAAVVTLYLAIGDVLEDLHTNDVAGEIKDCIVICRSFSFVFSGFAGLFPG